MFVMDSQLFRREWSRRRMAANGLGIILFRYADWLCERGYARNTIHQYTQAVEHFGQWRETAHPFSSKVKATEVDEFLSVHLAHCACVVPAVRSRNTCRAALARLLAMSGEDEPDRGETAVCGPEDVLLGAFDRHMEEVCGLSVATRRYRRRYALEFLRWRFPHSRYDIGGLCACDFFGYAQSRAEGLKRESLGVLVVSLRAFTRFLEFEGFCRHGLSAVWPSVARWRTSPPKAVLGGEEVGRLDDVIDSASPTGLRDKAILRLIVGLGLRCSEVAALRLEDVDWRAGTLLVGAGKQRRERLLPLPTNVGKALADYLHKGRPQTPCRFVMVCHRIPFGEAMTRERVRGAVRRVMTRAGLKGGGTHVLRHSFATMLHNRGASLKEVADVLGHQSPDTTAIYARVNLPQLRTVARPWPGGPS